VVVHPASAAAVPLIVPPWRRMEAGCDGAGCPGAVGGCRSRCDAGLGPASGRPV